MSSWRSFECPLVSQDRPGLPRHRRNNASVFSRKVLARYRQASLAVFGAFALGLLDVVVAALWLVTLEDNRFLYLSTIWLFAFYVVTLAAVAGWIVWQTVSG